jgi:hypothetical protein
MQMVQVETTNITKFYKFQMSPGPFIRPLSKCTIMYMIGAVYNPVRLSEIQNPKRWPLVPLRAA